jgi:hypothetical protein
VGLRVDFSFFISLLHAIFLMLQYKLFDIVNGFYLPRHTCASVPAPAGRCIFVFACVVTVLPPRGVGCRCTCTHLAAKAECTLAYYEHHKSGARADSSLFEDSDSLAASTLVAAIIYIDSRVLLWYKIINFVLD